MKCIFLTIFACVVTLEAKPNPFWRHGGLGMGLGTGVRTGVGTGIGTGIGYGLDSDLATGIGTGLGVGGLGIGLGRRGSGYSQGGSYGDNLYNSGANGFGNQGYQSGGFNNFHDVGHHHNSLTSITQAENTDSHDIGGSQAFDTGAQSNNGYNQFGNGRGRFGNEYANGHQMSTFL